MTDFGNCVRCRRNGKLNWRGLCLVCVPVESAVRLAPKREAKTPETSEPEAVEPKSRSKRMAPKPVDRTVVKRAVHTRDGFGHFRGIVEKIVGDTSDNPSTHGTLRAIFDEYERLKFD